MCGSVQWFTVGGSKKVAAACGARQSARNVRLEPQLRQGSAAPSARKEKSSRQTCVSVPTVKQVLSSLCGQLRSELRSAEGGGGSGGKSNKISLQALQSYLPKVQND